VADAANRCPTSGELRPGSEIPALVKQPSTVALFRYSAVTWNAHRIHYDRDYAASEGYPNVLVQGHLHGAYLTELLLAWAGPAAVLRRLQWSNRRAAYAGDTLTCRGRVTRIYEENGLRLVDLEIWTENQAGDICAPGTATVAFAGASS
jgi:hydroxyacyl-ACP dehydratase HTD2-like protein with hotdog domain